MYAEVQELLSKKDSVNQFSARLELCSTFQTHMSKIKQTLASKHLKLKFRGKLLMANRYDTTLSYKLLKCPDHLFFYDNFCPLLITWGKIGIKTLRLETNYFKSRFNRQ